MREEVAPSGELAWELNTLGTVREMLLRGTHNAEVRVSCRAPSFMCGTILYGISALFHYLCTTQFRNVLVTCHNFAAVSENITAFLRFTIGTKLHYGSERHLPY
jgi:hypothetical protein